ncbi:MAG TPA: DinB family protein, partial [Candidatus Acidoferrales bacterium]|nr:DinB family protein [Candidatus Acidoferrales bacterium]
MNELEMFVTAWEREAGKTLRLLQALPVTQYNFRPDAAGRSLGELAWHLAEADAYPSFIIETGQFNLEIKPPNIERPRQVEALAPGYERIHREAVARIRRLKPEELDRSTPFFARPTAIRDILWNTILAHGIHHRGQLSLMCRLAGGQVPA